MGDIVHSERVKGFTVNLELLEEFTPLPDTFDPTVTDIDTLRENVESGFWLYFCAKVTASYGGRVLAEEYLGCCVYESAEDFVNNSGYYDDMRDTVVEQAQEYLQAACKEVTL